MRMLALPEAVAHESRASFRKMLVKIGAKIVTHSRHIMFRMAGVAVLKEPVQRLPAAHADGGVSAKCSTAIGAERNGGKNAPNKWKIR